MEISAEWRRRLRDLYFSGSTLGGSPFGRLDQLPELRILLQRLVFRNLQTGAEEEVFEGMAVEDAMDDQAQVVPFEIDAVIPSSLPNWSSSLFRICCGKPRNSPRIWSSSSLGIRASSAALVGLKII